MLMLNYHNCNHYTVPTSHQSEVTVMQSDGNQPRQDDKSSQVEHANGSNSYISMHVSVCVCVCVCVCVLV